MWICKFRFCLMCSYSISSHIAQEALQKESHNKILSRAFGRQNPAYRDIQVIVNIDDGLFSMSTMFYHVPLFRKIRAFFLFQKFNDVRTFVRIAWESADDATSRCEIKERHRSCHDCWEQQAMKTIWCPHQHLLQHAILRHWIRVTDVLINDGTYSPLIPLTPRTDSSAFRQIFVQFRSAKSTQMEIKLMNVHKVLK